MLTELCQYLKNWFNRKPDGTDYPKYSGTFTIKDGVVDELVGELVDGQYFRIMGSLFNDGVHVFSSSSQGSGENSASDTPLKDEVFDGAVWSMAVPSVVIALAEDIAAWRAKYETVDSTSMSPFSSESFGGYSYTKSSGSTNENGTSNAPTWQSVFANRLAPWRKL